MLKTMPSTAASASATSCGKVGCTQDSAASGASPTVTVSDIIATTVAAGHADSLAWIAAGAMALNGLLFGLLLTWLALVDRHSIRGADTNPEESIEGRWYEKATSGAFHDTLVVVGLGAAILSFGGYVISPAAVGAALFVLMGCAAAIRYQIQKRRG